MDLRGRIDSCRTRDEIAEFLAEEKPSRAELVRILNENLREKYLELCQLGEQTVIDAYRKKNDPYLQDKYVAGNKEIYRDTVNNDRHFQEFYLHLWLVLYTDP